MTKKSTNKAGDNAVTDYSFWVAMPTWTREEAIALMSGQDPDYPPNDATPHHERKKVERLLERGFEHGAFSNASRVSPEECLSAMASFGLSAPKPLVAAAKANKISIKNWQAECERKDAEIKRLQRSGVSNATAKPNEMTEPNVTALKKRIASLQVAFLGLAIAKCKLKRDWSHSSIATNITNAISESGLSLGKETVRTHLAEAIEAHGEDARFHGEP